MLGVRLNISDPKQRKAILNVLVILKDKDSVATLIDILRTKDVDVENATFEALQKITGESIANDKSAWEKWYHQKK